MNRIEINTKLISSSLEAYKSIRTSILYMDNVRVIGVTSSEPNEGKTVTAFQLALSFARMGKKVLYVDCDLRRSSLKDYLLISGKRHGLSEYLSGQCDIESYQTNVEGLHILLSGKKPPNATDLLINKRFEKAIQEAKSFFDYVIVDTPPVLVGADASIVGRQCDGVVMVVRSEQAKKKNIKRSKQDLERNGVRLIGAVLNGVKKSKLNKDYYYTYEDYE